jgi:ABC-type antimicrobial peptide transport system permease subunit
MNLCGMISSRMDERMSELGVRKAYGATNASLISQVLTENLLLTLFGGLVGLILAYFIALVGGEWMYHLMHTGAVLPGGLDASFTMEMLFNPMLFLTVFGLCILLNLISALVPTLLALRQTIISSIQTKR